MMSFNVGESGAVFQSTCWELVACAAGRQEAGDGRLAAAALEELANRYWPAVYAYLRRAGENSDSSADLTQGFFADVVLWRDLFAQADREQGRLRSLMVTALERYRVDQYRRERARGERRPRLAQEALEGIAASARAAPSPHAAFERHWATTCVELAVSRCKEHFERSGKQTHWTLFERRVLQPVMSGVARPSMEELALELGCGTPGQAAAMMQVVRTRLVALLQEVSGEPATAPAEGEHHVLSAMQAAVSGVTG